MGVGIYPPDTLRGVFANFKMPQVVLGVGFGHRLVGRLTYLVK